MLPAEGRLVKRQRFGSQLLPGFKPCGQDERARAVGSEPSGHREVSSWGEVDEDSEAQSPKEESLWEEGDEEVQMQIQATTSSAAADKKTRWFGCLVERCEKCFETWVEARRHMKSCGYQGKKPQMSKSVKKGQKIYGHAPDRRNAPVENYILEESAVTEEELVEMIREYYENHRKNWRLAVKHAIRRKYGNFPFGKFGYGTFIEFTERHGFSGEQHL